MHDSMMIAEVGDIVNVSGSRMATPLAPPSPGRTPMSTPSVIPTSIRSMFIGVRMTLKPWNRALSSVIWSDGLSATVSVTQECQRIEAALGERHLEPHLEQQEAQHRDDHGGGDALGRGVLAHEDHETGDVQGRSH